MGFLSSIRKVVSNIANPVRGLAAATTGGLSLAAPPRVQTAIGTAIASFAAGGAIQQLPAILQQPTNQALRAAQQERGPWAAPGPSPSTRSQLVGARRMAQRRGGYLASPPAAGLPPAGSGFIYRPRRRRRRQLMRV